MKISKPTSPIDRLCTSTGLSFVRYDSPPQYQSFRALSSDQKREYIVDLASDGKFDLFVDLTRIVTAGTLADCINAVRMRESGQ